MRQLLPKRMFDVTGNKLYGYYSHRLGLVFMAAPANGAHGRRRPYVVWLIHIRQANPEYTGQRMNYEPRGAQAARGWVHNLALAGDAEAYLREHGSWASLDDIPQNVSKACALLVTEAGGP